MNKNALRLEARKRRRNLSPINQAKSARALAVQLRRLPVYRRASNIAFYIANDGELSPALALKQALRRKKRCYLPCLTARSGMIFRRYTAATEMTRNIYNILEPQPRAKSIPPIQLDVVLLPLVAFDRTGNRLGMGGGFYDRTFDFKRRFHPRKPVLVGLAHSIQEVDSLPTNDWDVPLDYVVTEKKIVVTEKKILKTRKKGRDEGGNI